MVLEGGDIDDASLDIIAVFLYPIYDDLIVEGDTFYQDRFGHRIVIDLCVRFIEMMDDIVADEDLFEIIDPSIETLYLMIESVVDTDQFDGMFIKCDHQK
jgi:hypothetical protein